MASYTIPLATSALSVRIEIIGILGQTTCKGVFSLKPTNLAAHLVFCTRGIRTFRVHPSPLLTSHIRHVRVHHVDKSKDDPLLRDVLSQRPDGPNRGRRRRAAP
jgi:hypothetical protein